jgi:hypothetical protein
MFFKRIIIFLAVVILIPIATYFAIRFARGERINLETKSLMPTGLLVATSVPEGASVFVDGKLKTATDETINLSPGEYEVEIKQDGFHSWKKTLKIEKELVTKADAHLFSTFPSLKSLTFTGATNPVLSPDKDKVVFAVAAASASPGKRGLWVLDISGRPLGLGREPRQIIQSAAGGRDFSDSLYRWSPDSKQVLVTLKDRPGEIKGELIEENFILDAEKLNDPTDLIDISPNLDSILVQWEKEEKVRKDAQISKLPKKLLEVLKDAADEISFSPDEKKLFYIATASAAIPEEIKPPLPASNTQPESREIEPGKIYVYDLIEDKNFFIIETKDLGEKSEESGTSQPKNLTWFPTSGHLFLVKENKVIILEYDNTNWVDVYTGPFENGFAFPSPGADQILILTSLGEATPPNLYAVGLK